MIREKETDLPGRLGRAKPLYIRLQLSVGEAQPVPPLSATLGQVRVNANDFCRNFNTISAQSFESGTTVNVRLYKNPDDTYYFFISGVSKSFLFFQSCDTDKFIPVEVLYDIFKIIYPNSTYFKAKEYFGTIRSINFKILFLRSYDCFFF